MGEEAKVALAGLKNHLKTAKRSKFLLLVWLFWKEINKQCCSWDLVLCNSSTTTF